MPSLRCVLVMLMVMPISGCGLEEYNAQLERTRKRLAYLDDENVQLTEPIQVPDAPSAIFFRVPKGVSTQPEGKPEAGKPQGYVYPWVDKSLRIPPFEVMVVLPGKGGDLDQQVKDFLGLRTDSELQSAKEETFVNQVDLAGVRSSVTYRRMTMTADEVVATAPGSAPLPERCVYKYDVYLSNADQMAIVIKEIDLAATRKRWETLAAGSDGPIKSLEEGKPKEMLAKLPKQRPMSLASFLTGGAAQNRLSARK